MITKEAWVENRDIEDTSISDKDSASNGATVIATNIDSDPANPSGLLPSAGPSILELVVILGMALSLGFAIRRLKVTEAWN